MVYEILWHDGHRSRIATAHSFRQAVSIALEQEPGHGKVISIRMAKK